MKIQIKHLTKEGELKTLFEASDTDTNKVKYVNVYNNLRSTLDSGCIFGFEGDEIILFHTFDYNNFGGVITRTTMIET